MDYYKIIKRYTNKTLEEEIGWIGPCRDLYLNLFPAVPDGWALSRPRFPALTGVDAGSRMQQNENNIYVCLKRTSLSFPPETYRALSRSPPAAFSSPPFVYAVSDFQETASSSSEPLVPSRPLASSPERTGAGSAALSRTTRDVQAQSD